jgi:hypothetical protein
MSGRRSGMQSMDNLFAILFLLVVVTKKRQLKRLILYLRLERWITIG